MKISMLQRRAFMAVPLLCILMACGAARAAEPSGTHPADEPAAAPAASAPAAASENSDWQDQSSRQTRRHRHNRDGEGGDVVNIGHDSTLPEGQKSDSVVSIFGSSTSDGETDDVVAVFGDTRVSGIVHDNAVSVFGNVYIDGKLEGDAVAVLGNMELGPHAEIDGDVFAIGGTLRRDPAAIVHGGVQDYFALDFGGAGWLRTWIHHCLLYGRPLALVPGLGWAWGLAFSFLALYATLALLFRDGITRCVQTFETQPGQSVLAALMAMLLTPVLVVLLFVTVIGIAAVPFVVFGLFCAGLFGKAVMLAWLGRRVTDKRTEGPMSHPVVAVLIGGALVTALYLVPVLGFIVYKLLGVLGLGAVVYTLILAARAHHAAKELPRPGPPAGAAPASAAASSPASGPGAAAASGASAASSAASSPGAAPASGGPTPPPSDMHGPAATTPPHAPITAALPRAGFWVRMVAVLLDAILVGFLMGVLHVQHLELLALAAYGAVMWKTRGTTIGGMVLDLRVVRLDGREIDWETAIVRALGCFLSLVVAGLGFFWIAFDHNSQAWHDKIAGTVVVRVAKGTPLV
jgi:uncharacterized RDD family membrane protein YckC